MTKVQLVEKPSVHLIGHSVISPRDLDMWAHDHGMTEVIEDSTPLGYIRDAVFDAAANSVDRLPEFGGRFCYRAWDKGRSNADYLRNIIESEHGSVLHHATVNLAISGVSRSLSLELLRHHAGADPSQESQRYVNASDVRFVVPPLILKLSQEFPHVYNDFSWDCSWALEAYKRQINTLQAISNSPEASTIDRKRILEAARSVLPNATETRLLWTMNLRAARHIIHLRGSEHADLEIRRLAVEFCRMMKDIAPNTFYDCEIITADDGFEATRVAHPKV